MIAFKWKSIFTQRGLVFSIDKKQSFHLQKVFVYYSRFSLGKNGIPF